MNPRARDLTLAGLWFGADQATKVWAASRLAPPGETIAVIPHALRFELAHNTGAMFSLFRGWPDPWRTILLTGLPLLTLPLIAWLLTRTPLHETCARLGLALILGGALGNLCDRVLHKHVIDFIVAYGGWEPASTWLGERFGTNQWPTFNVADIGLTCGAALLVCEVLVRRRPRAAPLA